MKGKMRFLSVWLPPLIWGGLIFLVSSFPIALKLEVRITFIDKILHFFAYAPLGFLVSRALWLSERGVFRKNFIILTLIFCLFYGLSDEFHQLFVSNREASLADVLFDILGSCAGLAVFSLLKGKITRYAEH